MNRSNPYQVPSQFGEVESSAAGLHIASLARVRPAVNFVAVASLLFAVGHALSMAYGFWFAITSFGGPNPVFQLTIVSTVRQGILSVCFAVLTSCLWRYSGSILRAVKSDSPDLNLVFRRERQCWASAGALAVVYVAVWIIMVVLRPFL